MARQSCKMVFRTILSSGLIVALGACGGMEEDGTTGDGVRSAMSSSPASYVWKLKEAPQGSNGDGVLRADGSNDGFMTYKTTTPTEQLWTMRGTTWKEIVPGRAVDLCFQISYVVKGTPDVPNDFCFGDFAPPFPVTGKTALKVPSPNGTLTILIFPVGK